MCQTLQKGPFCTHQTISANLAALGIQPNDTILLHCSLRKIGHVCGGAEAVITALTATLGPKGTLTVPTHTSENSDPAHWQAPPVPKEWWQPIRDNTPAYDARTSRTRGMGVIAETVRTWPGAMRSAHPQTSFAALGRNAAAITAEHAFDSMMGEKSPLARLEDLNAKVLLLGVGYDSCTAFHLAEYRIGSSPRAQNSFAAMVDGKREWVTLEDLKADSDDFEQLGAEFEAKNNVAVGAVGGAECRLFSLREAVIFAQEWFPRNREKSEKAQ